MNETQVASPRWDRSAHTTLTAETLRGGVKGYKFRDVLDEAFRQGLAGFELAAPVQTVMIPSAKKAGVTIPMFIAAVYAVFQNPDGTVERYLGIGDASYENAHLNVAMHGPRMAETRAKARALATAMNLDANLAEEFGGDGPASEPAGRSDGRATEASAAPPRKRAPIDASDYPEPNDGADGYVCEECGKEITDSKKYTAGELAAMSMRATGRILCYQHRFPDRD